MDEIISFADAAARANPIAMKAHQDHGHTSVARTWTPQGAADCKRCDVCTARPADPSTPAGPWFCLIICPGILTDQQAADLGVRLPRRGVSVGPRNGVVGSG